MRRIEKINIDKVLPPVAKQLSAILVPEEPEVGTEIPWWVICAQFVHIQQQADYQRPKETFGDDEKWTKLTLNKVHLKQVGLKKPT